MKKITAILLTLILAIGTLSAAAENLIFDNYDELVVGLLTPITGNFFDPVFGTNTSDMDIQTLLHDYRLVKWDTGVGAFLLNDDAVSGHITVVDPNGNHIYSLYLQSDMYFSDGSRITAYDYAFSILLLASKEIAQVGAARNVSNAILGVDEYGENGGKLKGVHVVDENTLEITIDGQYLPYFYEMGLLDYAPYPISVIAPGCKVADDGNCVYIEGDMTAELLQRTLLDAEDGYVEHPNVCSGVYTLDSYDGTQVELLLNPYNKRNLAKDRPSVIEHLIVKSVSNADAVWQLGTGELGLLNKVVNTDAITDATGLVRGADSFVMSTYARRGLSMVNFCCEKPTVSDVTVRRAIAMCMDKDAITFNYTGGYGTRADGHYGLGQWMYQMIIGNMERPEPKDDSLTWDDISVDDIGMYPFDPEAAEELLHDDGWERNADGILEKDIDGETVVLDLTLLCPQGNTIINDFNEHFIPYLAEIGIRVTTEAVPMEELLQYSYRQIPRTCDMIYGATNFEAIYDPAYIFNPNDAYQGVNNRTAIIDEELYQLALDMSATEPGDMLSYCAKWLKFQQRFVEVEPMIPVYMNAYFDFYTANLQDYDIVNNVSWAVAIEDAYLSDVSMLQEEEDEFEDDYEDEDTYEFDDEEVFFFD